MNDPKIPKRRPVLRWAAFFIVMGAIGIGTNLGLNRSDALIPSGWNPLVPLKIADPITPLTQWKLRRALATPEMCLATLADANVAGNFIEDRYHSDQCFIKGRVILTDIGAARINELETSCAVGLRMAMWEHHGLQPAAMAILGTNIAQIDQIGSYNCREMRTVSGATGRMSTHATAEAIDITGFRTASGDHIRLITDWDGSSANAEFLRAARDSSCTWFRVTLGPSYNSLHADHFHLQHTGWGLCN